MSGKLWLVLAGIAVSGVPAARAAVRDVHVVYTSEVRGTVGICG